jgi:hypothetical protein
MRRYGCGEYREFRSLQEDLMHRYHKAAFR